LTPKEEIPDEPYDPRVEVMGDVKGKAEQEKLLDLDLTDQVLFPQMNISVFWDLAADSMGACSLSQNQTSSICLIPPLCTSGIYRSSGPLVRLCGAPSF
jgi:hypothetical protein